MARKALILKSKKKQKYTTRVHNRCLQCGRSRGYIRMFGLCRLCFREAARRGDLPGITKASW